MIDWTSIRKIADNIEKLVLEEFDKRDNRDTDKLSIIGKDYHYRLMIAQRLEIIKLLIYPYFKNCPYCGKKFEREHVRFRGDIFHCVRNKDCIDKWTLKLFGKEGLNKLNKLNEAVSCGVSSKGIHVTYKHGDEEWL